MRLRGAVGARLRSSAVFRLPGRLWQATLLPAQTHGGVGRGKGGTWHEGVGGEGALGMQNFRLPHAAVTTIEQS